MTSTSSPINDVLESLLGRFGPLTTSTFRGQTRVVVQPDALFEVLSFLKDSGFDLLVDVTSVDYLEYRGAPHRYGMVYLLASTETGQRLTLRVFLDDPNPCVPSVVSLWEGANWLEREVWDLFGIRFEGHPDLRRLVMPEEFTAHPLRKDYPMQGRGERHNFPIITRDHS
ncbi:MAG: NADH-quinone oxidoreductase subunit C [Planctomycetota bacterium]|jgi:NADH-quinone oxidoreductase subunit C|nr:NADH-quinone oxidoreductase subunit C [Planctomycetia bacterium]MDO7678145.1 NADH-quinone oxidoreductase subunit C [Pirellulales bacterium]RLS21238.1 MAG: NADH-quinone oxidoreductase subunit C [Planctomycetota bacterium]TSA09275.1 MAG: NADH-quinone oxidoreductase subunit C [Planctomycetaceae bacterium]RLS30264.1 MAG: NADH-quinone oxidoreductase subunit C [Planctomycetota bacterium]